MQKLIDTLKQFGIEIPEDKQPEVKKTLSEYYKNVGEYNKAISKLETDRDKWKAQAEAAEETLKTFEGIDPANIQKELSDWKKKAEDTKNEYERKLAERDFADLLREAIRSANGKNEKAIKANLDVAKLMESKNQKEDIKSAIDELVKSADTSFLFESESQVRFTHSMNHNTDNKEVTKDQIMAIKDPVSRQRQIEANKHLFRKG